MIRYDRPKESRGGDGVKPIQLVNEGIDYIQAHHGEHLAVKDVADHVYLSPSWFAHVFAVLTGHSVKSYINQYRLYRAAGDLMTTDKPIAAIAMERGFDSQQSFTRHFTKAYGVPPGKYRKEPWLIRPPLMKVPDGEEQLIMQELKKTFHEVWFVKKPAYRVAGIQCDIHYHPVSEGTSPIAALYEKWIAEGYGDRIPGQVNHPEVYGMTLDSTPTGEAAYRICVEVDSLENLPEGVSGWSIPQTEYAVFSTRLDVVLSGEF